MPEAPAAVQHANLQPVLIIAAPLERFFWRNDVFPSAMMGLWIAPPIAPWLIVDVQGCAANGSTSASRRLILGSISRGDSP